jgi:sarcosine oxidase subunit beta
MCFARPPRTTANAGQERDVLTVQTADAVVIGGGINGAATAYHLVKKGLRNVLLIERGGVASGTTAASSAIVRQHYGHEVTAKMAVDSLRFFREFHALTGGNAEFKTCGMLVVAPEESVGTVRSVVDSQQRLGINSVMVDRQELRELEPEMFLEDLAGGAWESDAGYADPVGTTAGFIDSAVSGGARAWFNTSVTGLTTSNGQITGVETTRGKVSAEKVVIAAGPWTAGLAKCVGVDLPIKASRHPILVFDHPSGIRPRHILWDLKQVMYTRPEGAAMTLVGTLDMAHSQDESDPDDFNRNPTMDEIARWGEMLLKRFPSYIDLEARAGWCGIYEYSPDWHHIIDELPTAKGAWVVCGTSGHGFKLGPAAGDIVSDLVLGGTPAYSITDFRMDRFLLGHQIENRYADTIIG